MGFNFSLTFAGMGLFCLLGPSHPPSRLFKFQSHVPLTHTIQGPSQCNILRRRPLGARLQERTPLVGLRARLRGGLLPQHPLGQSSAQRRATIAWRWLSRPLFMQQYATARLKRKRARQEGKINGSNMLLFETFFLFWFFFFFPFWLAIWNPRTNTLAAK